MNHLNKTTYSQSYGPTSKGFSLVELMIVIMLALFITAGVFTVFISSKRLTSETITTSESLENGAFAMQILVRDLKQSYFFAQASGENKDLWSNIPASSISNDCIDDTNTRSFPHTSGFRPLWASTISTASGTFTMNCLTDTDTATELIPNSDYISIKRARGFATATYQANRYYLGIDTESINVYLGGNASAAISTTWEYLHHTYYLDKEAGTPRLRRISLQENEMSREEVLAEGIENMKFMFVLDAFLPDNRDQSIHAMVNSANVTDSDWNSGRVIGIKVFLLVRALKETTGYDNNEIYLLGDTEISAPGDGFKRKVLSRVLMFPNRGRL